MPPKLAAKCQHCPSLTAVVIWTDDGAHRIRREDYRPRRSLIGHAASVLLMARSVSAYAAS